MLLWGCISKVPLKHPWVQWLARNTLITKRSHDFEHHSLLQWKIQPTVNKRKGTQGKVQGRWAGAAVILQQAWSQLLTSLRNNEWQNVWSIAHQGRSPNFGVHTFFHEVWSYGYGWTLIWLTWLSSPSRDQADQADTVCVCACVCVCVITQSCPTLCHTLWTVTH